MSSEEHDPEKESMATKGQGRREFLKSADKFADLTPPAVTMLLSTAMNSAAIASSGGKPLDFSWQKTLEQGRLGL